MIEIRVPARVHAGLIDLSGTGYRTNGGIGWALADPVLTVSAITQRGISLIDDRSEPLSTAELATIARELESIARPNGFSGLNLRINGKLPPHRGLGGGTALRLAAIESLFAVHGKSIGRGELARLSGRGGTSGVGIQTYFDGGLIFDIGHPGKSLPAPSRDRQKFGAPLVLRRLPMPTWTVGILTCEWLPRLPIEDERALFASANVTASDVRDILYHVTFGLVGAALEGDAGTFASALDALQSSIWKRSEWACYGQALQDIANNVRRAGGEGVSLSSVGPSLFFLAENLEMNRLPPKIAGAIVLTTASNQGRQVRACA